MADSSCPSVSAAVRTLDLSLETILAVLSNRRTRLTLDALTQRSPPVSVQTLAEDVRTRERDADGEQTTASLEAIETSLHHVHLPELDTAGLIGFDAESGTVEAVSEAIDSIVQ